MNNTIHYKNKKTSLLTWTSAMDCWSFSLPAGKEGSCPMMVDEEGSICTSCYAMTGRYCMPNVLNAQFLRLEWTKDLLKNDPKEWHKIMVDNIKKYSKNKYFRVHDSGDFYSLDYIKAWKKVCEALPEINFWFPTRAWRFVGWVPDLVDLNSLSNVSVRPSGLYFNEVAPKIVGLTLGTTVITKQFKKAHRVCPKTIRHSSCDQEKCRSCWNNTSTIAYREHGYRVSDKIKNNRIKTAKTFVNLLIKGI